MQRSHKRIASTFPISRVYQAHIPTFAAGYWLFGFASKKYHPIDDLEDVYKRQVQSAVKEVLVKVPVIG